MHAGKNTDITKDSITRHKTYLILRWLKELCIEIYQNSKSGTCHKIEWNKKKNNRAKR